MTHGHSHIRIEPLQAISAPVANRLVSPRGVPLYVVDGGSEPVLHLDLVFRAGKGHEGSRAAAHATASLYSEGTDLHTSQYYAEQLEYYGATLRATANADLLSISLYCMTRVFSATLDIVFEMISRASFPGDELEIYKQNRTQKIRIALEQNETLANRTLSRSLFGPHPYGDTTTLSDVESITREDLMEHFELLGSDNLTVFLGGKVGDAEIETLFRHVDKLKNGKPAAKLVTPEAQPSSRVVMPGPQKHQSAIRMGRQIVSRDHEDFASLFVLNAVLGGFFGSRLMKNIREEKGLTYSIYSTLETLMHGACLIIATEANAKNTTLVESEILREMDRLTTEPVSQDELQMVKNYLIGNFMMQMDGPFRSMDTVKMMAFENLTQRHFEEFVKGVLDTTEERIQAMATRYLRPEDLHVSIVG